MFDLFTALFGGLYYGGKYISEKSKQKEFKNQQEVWGHQADRLELLYAADYELEKQTKEYIMNIGNLDEICELLSSDLEYVLGENWRTNFYLFPYDFCKPRITIGVPNLSYWVYHLLLSKKGKMNSFRMTSGFDIYLSKEPWAVKFLQCIEKNLIECGVKEISLVYQNGKIYGYPSVLPSVNCHIPHCRLW